MTRASLREYAAVQRERYLRAQRVEKHKLLNRARGRSTGIGGHRGQSGGELRYHLRTPFAIENQVQV